MLHVRLRLRLCLVDARERLVQKRHDPLLLGQRWQGDFPRQEVAAFEVVDVRA